jgi:protein-L-isoaspartate(D-aspartate) O-methyltransferase
MDEADYERARGRMVDEQIARRGIRGEAILAAMRRVPRHRFVLPEDAGLAYQDGPLPIGFGQTISQPYIVALLAELLELTGSETVLEVGGGSGYQAAVLAELAAHVHSIERIAPLAARAAETLAGLGVDNVTVHTGDGTLGLAQFAPYQAIVVAAAAPETPPPLLEQLDEGGRLVIPVGSAAGQYLQRWRRRRGQFSYDLLAPVAFVPLRGRHGWQRGEWERGEDDLPAEMI